MMSTNIIRIRWIDDQDRRCTSSLDVSDKVKGKITEVTFHTKEELDEKASIIPEETKVYPKIICNMARCKNCDQTIESKYRHDFVTCKCGKLSVDGGKSYLRRSFDENYGYEELTEYE